MKTIGKIRQLFISEPKLTFKLVMILIAVAVIMFEKNYIKKQISQVKRLNEEKELVLMVPEFEKKLHIKEVKPKEKMEKQYDFGDNSLQVKGIASKNGTFFVIINNGIYQEGDIVGDYKVSKISNDVILLVNDKTFAKKYFYFSEN